jgi:hypothetical protein
MHDSQESLQAMLKQPTSMAQQYEQLQLADGKGQLLVNLHQEQALAAEQLEEPLREVLKRSLAEGKPITQAWVRPGDAGLQLEFQNVVPVRDLQGKLQGVLGGSYRTPLSVLFSLEVASAEAGSQLLLIDRDLRPLALSSKGQWQLPLPWPMLRCLAGWIKLGSRRLRPVRSVSREITNSGAPCRCLGRNGLC